MLTDEKVISKVAELMGALDRIKKYNALTHSLKKFAVIVGVSIVAFILLLTLFEYFEFEPAPFTPLFFVVASLSLFVPAAGLFAGIFFVRKQINSVKEGEWKEELSHGFSSALKLLLEIDWERTFDEISMGRLGYIIYGFLKTAAYLVVTVFVFEFLWSGFTLFFFHELLFFGIILWGLIAIVFVFIILGKDLTNRFRELGTLDMLVWELRWFSIELGRAEFQT